MDINNIYSVMKQLENESSKNAKEVILKQNEGNTDFREALTFLLNPYIVTGISTKKMNKRLKLTDTFKEGVITDFKTLIEYLKKNNSGRDIDIMRIQTYIYMVNKDVDVDVRKFLHKFVTKTLKLGISEKTVNKVYGKDTIPTFAVMLAESYEKKKDKVKGKFYITLKLDGNRCIAIVEDGGVKFFSRKGQPIEGMVELEEQFSTFPNGVYDGEVLLVNKDNLPSDELFRATQKVIRKDGDKKNLEFYIFDTLTISEFKEGKSKRTYEQRRNILDTVIKNFTGRAGNIYVLEVLYAGEDKRLIPAYASVVEEQGYEGVMVNTASGLYQTKRVNDLLKVKSMKTADLLVMSIEKAIDGQFEGLLSRVNVEYKGNLVGVGSGFTLEQRRQFIEDPDLICGKIIEVQFFEESQDEKTGQPSLRFPVFKGIREDKTVDDINYGE